MTPFIWNIQHRQIWKEKIVARGWGWGTITNGYGSYLAGLNCFGIRLCWWLCNFVTILKPTELYTLKIDFMVYKLYFYKGTVDTGKVKHKKSTIWQRNRELCTERYANFEINSSTSFCTEQWIKCNFSLLRLLSYWVAKYVELIRRSTEKKSE